MSPSSFQWRRVLGAVLLFVALAVTVRLFLGDALEPQHAVALVRSVQGHPWVPAVFLVAYVCGTLLFLPAMGFHFVSGAAWGLSRGLLFNLVAINLTASLHFVLARRVGASAITEWARRHQSAARGLSVLSTTGDWVAVRFLPLPHAAVNLGAGVSSTTWRHFALGTLIGTAPIVFVHTYFATTVVERVTQSTPKALLSLTLAGTVLGLSWIVPRLRGVWRRRSKSK